MMKTKILLYKNGEVSLEERTLAPEEIAAMEAERIAFESSREYKEMRISELKAQLAETDYKALKFAEGWLSAEEYAPIKAERQAIRNEINALEAEILCL